MELGFFSLLKERDAILGILFIKKLYKAVLKVVFWFEMKHEIRPNHQSTKPKTQIS